MSRNTTESYFLNYCECLECTETPSSHPITNVPGHGRWFTQGEWESHRRQLRNRALASENLEQISEAYYNSTASEDPLLSGSSRKARSQINLPDSSSRRKRPRSPSPPLPPLQPSVRRRTQAPGFHDQHGENTNDSSTFHHLGQLLHELRAPEKVIGSKYLYFLSPPHLHKGLPPRQSESPAFSNLATLDPNVPSNSVVIGYSDRLNRIRQFAASNITGGVARTRLRSTILLRTAERYQVSLKALLFQEWTRQYAAKREINFVDTSRFFRHSVKLLPPEVLAIYLLVSALHLLSGASLDDCALFLGSIAILVQFVAKKSSSIHAQTSYKNMLKTPRSVLNLLDINPQPSTYVCCAECYCLYWIDSDSNDPKAYPNTCTNMKLDRVCGAPLRREKNTKHGVSHAPVREYHCQTPKEYLSHLFSRSDLKDYLYRDPVDSSAGSDGVWDIWDAPALRDFQFMDRTRFTKAPDGESRLIFSLNMDGFNPYGNHIAGKQVSVGAIYMVCLNLPPAIRHNPENVYLVGIVPGPKAPSKDEINHLLRPLMDDFLILWRSGIYLSRTHLRPNGIRVRCAIGPLICDLPAARQMSGFAHYTSVNFCSICKQKRENINDLNVTEWERRTFDDHRTHARLWKQAKTKSAREKIVRTYGVRWSEMLRLPYWNPSLFTMIDSMHAFYLRMFQYHIRDIWGMDINFDDDAEAPQDLTPDLPTELDMSRGNYVLRYGSKAMLKALPIAVLRELCREREDVSIDGNLGELAARLLEYRVRQGWFTSEGNLVLDDDDDDTQPSFPQDPTAQSLPGPPGHFLSLGGDTNYYFWNANKTMMKELPIRDLQLIFETWLRPTLSPQPSEAEIEEWSADHLRELIQGERRRLGIVDNLGKLRSANTGKSKGVAGVLGRDVLKEIRKDIEQLNLPSWHSTSHRYPGEKRWGKLTAAQWRTFCIVNLPVTLVRLWGSAPSGSVEQSRLQNFMHLVTAVKFASMYNLNEERISKYEYHMHTYLTSLRRLYPGVTITPYQHLSLHFGEQLRNFGPVHAWRCFAYERYNHILQGIPTNQRFGEYAFAFCMVSALTATRMICEKAI
ncbi:hypothetical protein EST38_g14314 [Candolleomyces aberdarensis]|uniref:DUF4218 domain-containing protein n=1 Tax=Candolleomyces aberdarensis TaxID=2316362 RepID=A0A4Q2D003_9AGAR|nr:hypothetical protein EST38_g14314 [Candolleomyces aberdarensis]